MAVPERRVEYQVEAVMAGVSLWLLAALTGSAGSLGNGYVGLMVAGPVALATAGVVLTYWVGSRAPLALAALVAPPWAVQVARAHWGDAADLVAVYSLSAAVLRLATVAMAERDAVRVIVPGLLVAAAAAPGDAVGASLAVAAAALGEVLVDTVAALGRRRDQEEMEGEDEE